VLIIFGLSNRTHHAATMAMMCERCGQYGAHNLARITRRFSIFFIPLIPIGSRYEDTCTVCGRVRTVPKNEAEAAMEALPRLR
jgi:hypothetical protein